VVVAGVYISQKYFSFGIIRFCAPQIERRLPVHHQQPTLAKPGYP